MTKLLRDLTSIVVSLIEVLLVFRFLLKLLGANPQAGFVNWVYQNTAPLIWPFLFAFPTPRIANGFILEFTTVFAIFAYAFLGYILSELWQIIDRK